MMKILLISDNVELLGRFRKIVKAKQDIVESHKMVFDYAFSSWNKALKEKFAAEDWIAPLNIKSDPGKIAEQYQLVISLHCKQIFPDQLVEGVRCVNIHPGLNPHNRGWFPQVFSIINGLPSGATIHEIDTKLDHGPVICQKEVPIRSWDTSITAYNRILDAEMELLDANFEEIMTGQYETFDTEEGNLNLKADFDRLCELDLDQNDSMRNHLNKLRALTHGDYANAYYRAEDGAKVYVKVILERIHDGE
ncbi:MAG: dTDP-4-amino-4,6-dideoxyglucose formyltransferase [Cyclobacteriaceae bacterium]